MAKTKGKGGGQLSFVKMSGAGNDFVVFDNRERNFRLSRTTIARLCHRQFGIGADGLLAVEPARRAGHDFRMRYYNADGGEAEMCGNGSRCIALFYHRLAKRTAGRKRAASARYKVETMAGTIDATVDGAWVTLGMVEPKWIRLNRTLSVGGNRMKVHTINTGVPHAVIFVRDVEALDVVRLGRAIRWHRAFQPAGTNVNFVQIVDERSIRVRTFERGVENETLACGTGVTASAIIAHLVCGTRTPVRVTVQSGCDLEVDLKDERGVVRDVLLGGPAEFVFAGTIAL